MKPQSITPFYLNLARIFLLLAIVKAIDFGFVDTSADYSGDLPCQTKTEHHLEKEFFQDRALLNFDVLDVSAKVKISGNHLHFKAQNFLQNRFFIYKQKLIEQAKPEFSSTSFFLVTSKSNIPHLNLEDGEPSSPLS